MGSLRSAMNLPLPTPALPGSGSMGMISARFVKAPLVYNAAKIEKIKIFPHHIYNS